MDKITRKTSFGQWFSPINFQSFEEDVKTMQYNRCTKKLTSMTLLRKKYLSTKKLGGLFDENCATM